MLVGATHATLRIVDDEQPGSLDFSFVPQNRPARFVDCCTYFALQADGKVLVREAPDAYDWDDFIVRLNPDGSKDSTFIPLPIQNYSMVVAQPDGKLLAYGRPGLVRLHSDGSVDPGFRAELGQIIGIYSILPQPDGRTLVHGQFSGIGLPGNSGTVRLLPDGSRDSSFVSAADGEFISTMQLTKNGEILIGGGFTRKQRPFRAGLVKLRQDGRLETGFNPPEMFGGVVSELSVDSQGRIAAAGNAKASAVSNASALARFLPDGALDVSFRPPLFIGFADSEAFLTAVLAQDDGRVIVAGEFTRVGNAERVGLVRLNPDGSVDESFGPLGGVWRDYGLDSKYPGPIGAIVPANDGQILIAGGFNFVDSVPASFIARLNGDPVHHFASVLLLPDASVQLTLAGRSGYRQIVEASQDLKHWRAVFTNIAAPDRWEFRDKTKPAGHHFYRAHLAE